MNVDQTTKPDQASAAIASLETDEALYAAESLFDSDQLYGYYTIKAFLELFHMVQPQDRKKLAQILEGLVVK